MSGTSTGHHDDPGQYEIRVQGRLEPRWAAWFDGMTLTSGSDGTTTIHGPVVDQAALHGLLRKLRDIGLPLLSIAQAPPGPPVALAVFSNPSPRTTRTPHEEER